MTNNSLWNDSYWLLIVQAYDKKPVGVKSEYSHTVVELAIELHLSPKTICEQMRTLESHATPSLQRLWEKYNGNARLLTRDIKQLRSMAGFGEASLFYEGVDTKLPTEHDYRPIDPSSPLTPVMLTIILALYFTLTTNTMVAETPEVAETARLIGVKPEIVVNTLEIFQTFDPILKRTPLPHTALVDEAQNVWKRFCNEAPETLQDKAEQLKEYFK